MRRLAAVAIIGLLGVAPFFLFHILSGAPAVDPADQAARHLSTLIWDRDEDWFGGFSGIEVAPDGGRFYAVTDRGHLVRGMLQREAGLISKVDVDAHQRLVDKTGTVRPFPHDDAEGLALDADGRLYVSFEVVQRILSYGAWDAPAEWPAYTRAWRALGNNKGLELVAVDPEGTLFTLPEGVLRGATEALVYRRLPNRRWDQPFTLPVDDGYLPVGGDFGPDGRFYLLERGFEWLGFRNRVRAMRVSSEGITDIETVLETPHRVMGNLEGLAVWADASDRIRLTLISDDNFRWVLRTRIVEYVLTR